MLDEIVAGKSHKLLIRGLVDRYRAAKAQIATLDLESVDALVDTLFRSRLKATDDLLRLAAECGILATDANDLRDRIVIRVSQEDVPSDPNFVRVMSLHRSKGLTSKSVYVVGALHGILPMVKPDDSQETVIATHEEHRRLFYVAITRASDQLVISSSRSLPLADAARFNIAAGSLVGKNIIRTLASPYIAELGPRASVPVLGSTWIRSKRMGQTTPD